MTALDQRLDHKAYGARNTVDFRRIGLGDDRDAERASRSRRFHERIHARAQCAPDMKPG